jgi:hypothetical protein
LRHQLYEWIGRTNLVEKIFAFFHKIPAVSQPGGAAAPPCQGQDQDALEGGDAQR